MLVVDRRQQVSIEFKGPKGKDPKTGEALPELPQEEWATFYCRLLTASEFLRAMDSHGRGGGHAESAKVLSSCLRGWANVKGMDGEEIPFPSKASEAVEMLPGGVVMQVAGDLIEASSLHKADLVK